MSWLDDVQEYTTKDPDRFDYTAEVSVCQNALRRMRMELNSSVGGRSNRSVKVYDGLLAEFQQFNQEYKVGAMTMNDLRFYTLCVEWYCDHRDRDSIRLERRLCERDVRNKAPTVSLYAQLLVDATTRVCILACRHAALVNTPAMEDHPDYPFPSQEQISDVMKDVAFVQTCVLWNGHKALKAALTRYTTLLYDTQTDVDKKNNDDTRALVQPSTAKLLQHRKYLTADEPSDQQGWLWDEELPSYVARFSVLSTYVFCQLEYEYRLKARYKEGVSQWKLPFQSRDNARMWLVDRFKREQPDTLLRNLMQQVCEHHLPIGARLHSRRQKSTSETPIAADIILQRYAGNAVTMKVAMELESEERIAAIARNPKHPLYSFVFLAVVDLWWMQLASARHNALGLYDHYVIPRSLFLFTPMESFEAEMRHHNTPRPLLMLLCGKWCLYWEREWHSISGGVQDTIDAILLMLLIVRDRFDYHMEDGFNVKEIGERFLGK